MKAAEVVRLAQIKMDKNARRTAGTSRRYLFRSLRSKRWFERLYYAEIAKLYQQLSAIAYRNCRILRGAL